MLLLLVISLTVQCVVIFLFTNHHHITCRQEATNRSSWRPPAGDESHIHGARSAWNLFVFFTHMRGFVFRWSYYTLRAFIGMWQYLTHTFVKILCPYSTRLSIGWYTVYTFKSSTGYYAKDATNARSQIRFMSCLNLVSFMTNWKKSGITVFIPHLYPKF